MRRVLITGKGSYIGTNFRKYLEQYPNEYEVVELDVKDEKWKEFDFNGFDVVYHVAGLAHSTPDESQRELYYRVNTDLTYETAKKAKEAGIKQFIFMSSIIVYGSGEIGKDRIITKDTPLTPDNFYGDSKKQAEIKIKPMEDKDFKIVILRPPMIYGPGSKGNYPILAKFAKKTPIFPTLKNKRSMLFLGNLMEFVKLMIDNEERGVFLPQNKEYVSSYELVKEIAQIHDHKVLFTGLFNSIIKLFNRHTYVNKVFGNLTIDQNLSNYKYLYDIYSFKESIQYSENLYSVFHQKKKDNKVCIINCFDTYEHRVNLLYNYFYSNGFTTTIYTSNFRHIEKCYRSEKKDYFNFVNTLAYKRNLSIKRLKSHKQLANDIFEKIENEQYDILWVLIPPNSFVKNAALYKKNHVDTKVVFDLIDLWPETMPFSNHRYFFPFNLWRNSRDKYLDIGDAITTECKLYQKAIPERISRDKIYTLYLARTYEKLTLDFDLPSNKISLCYLGSINNIIDIKAISYLIKKIQHFKPTDIHIIGDGEKKDQLIKECKQAGANVYYHGKIYDQREKYIIISRCHYGLNIMKESVFVGLSMKSLDYFEFGLPILNNIRGDTWEFVENNKIGYNLDNNCDYQKIVTYDCELRKQVRSFFEINFGVDRFEKTISKIISELQL